MKLSSIAETSYRSILQQYHAAFSSHLSICDQDKCHKPSVAYFQGNQRAKISRLSEDGNPVEYDEENVRTLHDALKRGARLSGMF